MIFILTFKIPVEERNNPHYRGQWEIDYKFQKTDKEGILWAKGTEDFEEKKIKGETIDISLYISRAQKLPPGDVSVRSSIGQRIWRHSKRCRIRSSGDGKYSLQVNQKEFRVESALVGETQRSKNTWGKY